MRKYHANALVAVLVSALTVATACSDSGNTGPGPDPIPDYGVDVKYTIADLGPLTGGSFSQAIGISHDGIAIGLSDLPNGSTHAVVWSRQGMATDIGSGDLNSGAFGAGLSQQIIGQTETTEADPNNANFCGYGTGRKCKPFIWQNGVRTMLPLLGGNNGTVGDNVNSGGMIPGMAETADRDPACPGTISVVGTGPQVLAFKPVVWGPKADQVRALKLPAGDNVGMAIWVNDAGEAVGYSGTCANTTMPPFGVGPHAVMWKADGTPVDLGTLGGNGNSAELGMGNAAHAINNRGQVVGVSAVAGNTATHGFLWTTAKGISSLDPLPGQLTSGAVGINDLGDAVGISVGGDGSIANMENPTAAVIWRRNSNQAVDLNTLTATPTSLYLLFAFGINNAGEIVGYAMDLETQALHAFRATPVPK